MLGGAGELGTAPDPQGGGGGSSGGSSGGQLGMDPEPEGGGGAVSYEPAAGAGSGGASAALLIDDFEDGDARAKEPLGWWYPINDGTGTQGFGIEPTSNGATSVYALRAHGSGFEEWGAAVGVNLVGDSTSFDALSYRELCFVARVEADTESAIRVLFVRDSRSYSRELSLSENWTRYCLPLGSFVGPDDSVLVPSELVALQFFFAPVSPFAVWLDDVEFVP